MGRYAILAPAYTGHLNPMCALAHALERRGHSIAMLTPHDAESKVRKAALEFIPVAQREYPPGEWARLAARAGERTGFAATRVAAHMIALLARGIQRELPGIAAHERFDGLLMDQICVGAEGVCEVIGLPLAVGCAALAFHIESRVPPCMFTWRYRPALAMRVRNIIGQFAHSFTGWQVAREVMPYRFRHGLRPMGYHYINELRPSLVQVAQQPAFFDFPRRHLPDHFHYTGPWIDSEGGSDQEFPWARLDGRPIIYASLGTLQNRLEFAFRLIAEACAGLDAQLVLALGREGASLSGPLPGNPIVVDYAPQPALVQRATLVITHAGLNTTLECLRAGVPMVALPITNDQPGVAARSRYLEVVEFIPLKKASAPMLREAVLRVLRAPAYRERAQYFAAELKRADGRAVAAELIESAFVTRQRVPRTRPILKPATQANCSAVPR